MLFRQFRPALTLVVLFTLFTGGVMPLLMNAVSGAVLPHQAGGSLIFKDGKIIGSELIGENFTKPIYFHGRPSATTDTDPKDPTKTIPAPYNADNSSGSNLAPTAQALLDRVKGDIANDGVKPVPGDMVTTSASGLDPDISPENALRQVAAVAAARKLPEDRVRQVVMDHTKGPFLGLIGEPRVNVLELNLALDALPAG
jgi:K+-transporting ATPase ATPase C chain